METPKIILLIVFIIQTQLFARFDFPQGFEKIPIGAIKKQNEKMPVNRLDSEVVQFESDNFPLARVSKTINSIGTDRLTRSRSASDAALYKTISPSVVLIVTEDSIGTGSLIDEKGNILTNWHVVGSNLEVGVFFKPPKETDQITKKEFFRGKVTKIDQIADLALIQVNDPPRDRKPIKLGDSTEINVGADAHAIGHPEGNSWSYTKGVVSQFRPAFQWATGKGKQTHQADVLQTQTPINPGNSGGPLLSENKTIIGVNSFKKVDSEGVNYAVSVDEIEKFLRRDKSRFWGAPTIAKAKDCKAKEVSSGKSEDGLYFVTSFDSKCSGVVDMDLFVPIDKSKDAFMRMDRNHDSQIDAVYFIKKNDTKIWFSLWDTNYDGNWDLVGNHPDGAFTPSRYQDYQSVMGK